MSAHPTANRDADALFISEDGRFVPTRLTQGPWSPDHQFGGAPAALIAHLAEGVAAPAPMRVTRLTIDLLRPVPIAPLTARCVVQREGKRTQVIGVSLLHETTEVVHASVLRMRIRDLGDLALPGRPAEQGPPGVPMGAFQGPPDRPGGPSMGGALEYACDRPEGMFVDPTWVRLRVPVVRGQLLSGLPRMAYVADCGSGYGNPRGLPLTGINVDISLAVVRYTDDEWICLSGDGWVAQDGIGLARATLSDHLGVLGTVVLSRLVERTG